MCQRWGLAGPTADDLALIVSELTTNAVVHAPSDTICVQVTLNEHEAHVVVVDRGPHPAFVAKQPDNDEHGRGLCLVEALADRFVSMSAGDGTLAWASMNLA